MAEHNEFGKEGEKVAVDFLIKKGYIIKYKNYRYLKAEIDIIAQKDEILSIVEVKSRSTNFMDNLNDLIPQKKINLLVLAANQYVVANNIDVEVRFDIIRIQKNKGTFEVEHIENAFYHF